MSQIILDWHDYKFFPYEKELGLQEIRTLSKNKKIAKREKSVVVENISNHQSFENLTYFSKIRYKNKLFPTIQAKLENTRKEEKLQKRQFTRYSVHGLHEYKGKFNPQVVRALLNILSVKRKNLVLDPFCGSGTSLIECAHNGISSVGFDVNPLAVYVSNAKLKALSTSYDSIKKIGYEILDQFKIEKSKKCCASTERELYLKKWFPLKTFRELESLSNAIELKGRNLKNIFYCIASDNLRNFSLQEPADLRIRKRRTPLPSSPFIEHFISSLDDFCFSLQSTQKILGKINHNSKAYEFDSRHDVHDSKLRLNSKFDCVITSPPYATALPYIDTQRLSLVWLNLLEPSKINPLDAFLIGSRENSGSTKSDLLNNMIHNENSLPIKIWNFCLDLNNSLKTTDGFRRRAVPYLLYRYFSEMGLTFENISSVVKTNGSFAMIVGNNQTTLGGKLFDIDTSSLLVTLAKSRGWKLEQKISLQPYKRYGLHKQNAVKSENLIIIRNNG